MFTDAQALIILTAAWPHCTDARSQAIAWASLVNYLNDIHRRGTPWTVAELDAVYDAGLRDFLFRALGGKTPAAYLDAHA